MVALAFRGSVAKEGPAAHTGAALAILFADILRLRHEDRRCLVICGISADFAAGFGTTVSGALFGIEVLSSARSTTGSFPSASLDQLDAVPLADMARTHDCSVQRKPAVKPIDDALKDAVVLRERVRIERRHHASSSQIR